MSRRRSVRGGWVEMINIRSSKSKGMPRVHRGAGAGCDMQHVERGRDAGRALSTHQAERERERAERVLKMRGPQECSNVNDCFVGNYHIGYNWIQYDPIGVCPGTMFEGGPV